MSHPRRHRNPHRSRLRHANRRKNTRTIDRVTYICAIVEPFLSLPQVYAIWSQKSASGVSISSWVGFWLFGFVWLWYGIVHKDKAIIIYETLYIVVEAAIVLGAVLYGGHW